MQPHLIHIGFPKCASTFLQQWFAAHPQIAYKPGGLAGAHSVYDLIQRVLDAPGPERCQVTSAEQISTPTDPGRFGAPNLADSRLVATRMADLCRVLARLFPNASILMVTRNHADLLVSSFSQVVRVGGHLRDADYAKLAAEGFREISPIDYDFALSTYRDHFNGRVLALPYELLVEDRPAFLAQVADFMGVDRFDIPAARVNESLDPDQLYWYPRIARLARRVPGAWLRRGLIGLHVRLIRSGAWRPLLLLLKRLTGAKAPPLLLPPGTLRGLDRECEDLLKSEVYAPYREVYRGEKAPAPPA